MEKYLLSNNSFINYVTIGGHVSGGMLDERAPSFSWMTINFDTFSGAER